MKILWASLSIPTSFVTEKGIFLNHVLESKMVIPLSMKRDENCDLAWSMSEVKCSISFSVPFFLLTLTF